MRRPSPARLVPLAVVVLAVAGAAPAHADPIPFFFGTYEHVSTDPNANTNTTTLTGVSTFYLRDPDNIMPDSVIVKSNIGVTLQPVTDPMTKMFPVTLFDPATNANDFQVATAFAPTTTFDFSAPEYLVEAPDASDLLLVSGLTLESTIDLNFSTFLHSNGAFFAALEDVTLIPPSTPGGTPTVVFATDTPKAPFLVLIPEPVSLLCWVLGGAGAAWLWRRRRPAPSAA